MPRLPGAASIPHFKIGATRTHEASTPCFSLPDDPQPDKGSLKAKRWKAQPQTLEMSSSRGPGNATRASRRPANDVFYSVS